LTGLAPLFILDTPSTTFTQDKRMGTSDACIRPASDASTAPAFLVFDTESIPDGKLLTLVKYAGEQLTPEQAIAKAQAEARERSRDNSDFLPVTFQYPIATSVVRVGPDFRIQALTSLDAPQFRPREIISAFWRGVARYNRAKLVSFNGRGFDLPLLELGAFRYGLSGLEYFQRSRHRFNGHLDLFDWLSNFGACRLAGGLDVLSKLLGKPGKMEMSGDQVYAYYQAGKVQEINDYCTCDALDTYFVFLRTRVLTGELSLDEEHNLVVAAKHWLTEKAETFPAVRQYLNNWGDWEPWP
jgi:predicted PolB exonuclease-like 3'-5' exonuclease